MKDRQRAREHACTRAREHESTRQADQLKERPLARETVRHADRHCEVHRNSTSRPAPKRAVGQAPHSAPTSFSPCTQNSYHFKVVEVAIVGFLTTHKDRHADRHTHTQRERERERERERDTHTHTHTHTHSDIDRNRDRDEPRSV
jgi:hypothetical protein